MTTDEAVLDYIASADDLEELARTARASGWEHWATEVEGYAYIAHRAADAEVENPDPHDDPCSMCGGTDRCDISWHAARRAIS